MSSTIAELKNGLDTDGALPRGSWTAASQVSLATARHEMTGEKKLKKKLKFLIYNLNHIWIILLEL